MDYRLVILVPLLLLTAVGTVWFVRRYCGEKRSLWLGVSFLAALIPLLGLIATILLMFESVPFVQFLLIAGAIAVVAVILMFPFVLIATMLISGVQLIRKEGFSLSNLLSLGAGMAYIVYLVVWSMLYGIQKKGFFSFLYLYLSFCLYFTLSVFALYTISSLLNLLRVRKKTYRSILVLGCGLKENGEVTPLLAGRVDKGIEAYRQNPGSRMVLSGGKGGDEVLAEGEAMKHYALQQGVPKSDILVEDKSANTRENLLFSEKLIREDAGEESGNLLVVTNNYHVLRALLLAKNLGIPCDGRGSRTKLYFSLNAFVREWIAYLVIWRKKYVAVLAGGFVVIGAACLLDWCLL